MPGSIRTPNGRSDASDHGVSAVLSQLDDTGVDHHYSRKFLGRETRDERRDTRPSKKNVWP